jgi:hypothetical protein
VRQRSLERLERRRELEQEEQEGEEEEEEEEEQSSSHEVEEPVFRTRKSLVSPGSRSVTL